MQKATLQAITTDGMPKQLGGKVVGFKAHDIHGNLLPVPKIGAGHTPKSLRQLIVTQTQVLRDN